MEYILQFLPRKWLQYALILQWRKTLTRGENIRLDHFGATGNPNHHPFQWADNLEE